jgi:hypothetical protein
MAGLGEGVADGQWRLEAIYAHPESDCQLKLCSAQNPLFGEFGGLIKGPSLARNRAFAASPVTNRPSITYPPG